MSKIEYQIRFSLCTILAEILRTLHRMRIWHNSVVMVLGTKCACSEFMVLSIAAALNDWKTFSFVWMFWVLKRLGKHRERWTRLLSSLAIKKRIIYVVIYQLGSPVRDSEVVSETGIWNVSFHGHHDLDMFDSWRSARGWHWGGTVPHCIRHILVWMPDVGCQGAWGFHVTLWKQGGSLEV